MGGRMSDLEAKIKITVENGTAAGFNQAANSAESASKAIENAIGNVKARLKTHFDDMKKSMEQAFNVNPSTFKNLGDAQEGMFNKISSSARKVYEETRTPMEQFKAKLAEVNQLLNLGAIDVETYERKVQQLNSELEQTDGKASVAAGGLGKIGSVLAGFASLSFAKSMLDTADAMQSINAQVRQVVSSESEYLAVQRQLLDVANNTRASLESTANLYVSTSRALKDYGYTQQEILTFTEATNNAMAIGGVQAQQQAAALMQLSQALGSGVLQGDEFKSIAEAAPILLDTIAEYMGKSRAEIKKLGSEGQLTADVIFKAISGASEKFGEQAAKMPMTMGQALTVFSNNWQSMVSKLLNDSGAMSGIASIIKLIADNLNLVVPIVAGFAVAVAAAVAPTLALNVALLANPFGIVAVAIGAVIGLIAQFGDEIDVFGDGWSNLSDVIQAVWQVITETIGEAVDTVKSWFGELTAWVDESVGGWSAVFERVMGLISSTIGAYINVYINTFATGWMLIKEAANNMPQFFANLGKSIGKVFLSAIDWMINKAIDMINGMIDYANKAASMVGASGIDKLRKVDNAGKIDDGGLGGRIADSMTKDRAGAMANAIKERAANIHEAKAMRGGGGGGGSAKAHAPAGGGGGGSGRKGGGRKGGGKGHAGGSGAAQGPMQGWEEEIKAQKLAHREMERETLTHQEWDLAREAAYWREKLATVDAGSKTGLKLREKILTLEDQLSKQSTEAKMNQVAEWEKLDKHKLEMEKDAADQALSEGRISQLERLDLEIEFENRRYQIAYDALQERIALAEQDPTYSQTAIDKLKAQMAELGQGHERTQAKNEGKRESQRRKDAPNVMEMLQDGGKNVWQEAQQQMGQAFTAMLTRTQNFRTAMNNFFKSMGQTFIQEMVTKPLMGMMQRMVQESAIYKMIFGTKETLETAAAAKTAATKATETTSVVTANATQAASGAAASQASIPYVGPILAVAAMAAIMAAVMGLMGGGGGSQTTTTTTRIPSAAGGWDIPAGINPLTQLHENEMVLPAEHAQTIREMAGQSGGDDSTIIINSTGGDFIHKKDLAKLLRQMKRDFKFV